jgi:uncharacterized membrane-anchored protein YjiN (DUF445 family)
VQVETTITKAIRTALPELVKKQVEETVPPILQTQAEQLNQSVRQVLIPKLEAICQDMSQEQASEAVKRIIKEEFQQALIEEILPEVEKAISQGLEKVRDNLTRVDDDLFKKIVNDENRNRDLVQIIE